MPLVYSASIAATAPNYTAQCIAAQQAGVDALFIGHSGSVVMKVAADCERQGYKPVYITQGTGFVMTEASAPGLSDRLWSSYPILPFWGNSAQVKDMKKALDKYSPGAFSDPNFSEYAAQAWTGGKLIEAAVAKTGSRGEGQRDRGGHHEGTRLHERRDPRRVVPAAHLHRGQAALG